MRLEREAEAKGEQESSRSLSPEQGARAYKKPGTSIQGLCQHLTGPCLHTYTHVCTLCAAVCAKALDVQGWSLCTCGQEPVQTFTCVLHHTDMPGQLTRPVCIVCRCAWLYMRVRMCVPEGMFSGQSGARPCPRACVYPWVIARMCVLSPQGGGSWGCGAGSLVAPGGSPDRQACCSPRPWEPVF